MEAARVEEHRQIRVDRHGAQPRHVRALVAVEARAVNPLRDEHLARRQVAHDNRCGHGVEAAVLHRLDEGLRVLRLVNVVRLGDEPAPPLVDERARELDVLGEGLLPRERIAHAHLPRREEAEDEEVERNLGEDVGPLHLHRHFAPVLERRLVHLPDRRGRERFVGDLCKHGGEVLHVQLVPHDLTRALRVERGHGILQRAQLKRVRLGDQVRPDRQRLPELDERRAELRAEHERLLGALLLVLLRVA
mmetsp:Transcript_556/g.1719  ORF Transcript_556/g.1719 Transcript_556/m.1719 type:complete len:248 (-) Transcript_556:237-980(-)